jgi:hypothetical protein
MPGILDSLFGSQKKQQQQQQQGGSRGDGYAGHRQRGRAGANELIAASATWRAEVQAVRDRQPNLTFKEALQQAAAARRARGIPSSKYVPKGRSASRVSCAPGKKCPGAYDRPASPYQKRSHRLVTLGNAKNLLREFYRAKLHNGEFSTPTGAKRPQRPSSRASGAMRKDISRKAGTHPLSGCPTKQIRVTYKRGPLAGKTVVRNVAQRSDECADSWLYRARPNVHDMRGLDWGVGKSSPAYGKRRLSVYRKDRRA